MTNKKLNKLFEIAREVRIWTQEEAKKTDEDIDSLCGFCAIAAGELQKRLIDEKIKSYIAANTMHCFNVVSNTHILDITATQFGHNYEAIVYRPLEFVKFDDEPHWNAFTTFKSAEELLKWQKSTYWVRSQWTRG